MSGIPHDHYEPRTGGQKWLHSRLPIVGLMYDTIMLPTPKNLNWMWIWGIVLTFCLLLQIITGIVLVMHYTPHVDLAFASVEHIMRDVNGGYMLRYLHANGASLFFIAVYLHIFRGLFYGSYKAPREVTPKPEPLPEPEPEIQVEEAETIEDPIQDAIDAANMPYSLCDHEGNELAQYELHDEAIAKLVERMKLYAKTTVVRNRQPVAPVTRGQLFMNLIRANLQIVADMGDAHKERFAAIREKIFEMLQAEVDQ